MASVAPLDQTRDKLVDSAKTEYVEQTHTMTINKLMTDFIDFFKKMFNMGSDSASKAHDDIGKLQNDISHVQSSIEQMQAYQPVLLTVIASLTCVALTYLVSGSILGETTHYVAVLVFGISYFFFKTRMFSV
jgi:hypothetical protein